MNTEQTVDPRPTIESVCDAIEVIEGEGFSESNEDRFIEAFQVLINSGVVWSLQGYYGRTARSLIESGACTPQEQI